ncbi:hypothetical protein K443DRAFT_5566 [Laccaria amethystina LaAM-08-1]|uniref:tripeptidyl-peptidase II n=1 Tax=Laccaria amethystina LaAM-08-1 TaxID=1095629 RepID=A0A0C9XE09_9AGAR|nr:hypothetical protein K443DRAFT_5566 [Laccaria amethystina LaAM-08-1]
MQFLGLALSLLLVTSILAAPPNDYALRIKETVSPPRGWAKHSIPPPDHNIALRIGLQRPNFPVLERHLYEVSSPDHERYGQHLSKEEVEALVAPHQESIDSVNEWLFSHGFKESDLVKSPAKDWVTVKVPVSLAEKILDATYYVWKHIESGDSLVRTTGYSLPSHLHHHVDVIQPTTLFGRFKKSTSTIIWSDKSSAVSDAANGDLAPIVDATSGVTVDASCNENITISCLQQIYNIVDFVPSARGNSIGITGYLNQSANVADLQQFFVEQRPDAVNSTFQFISVNGGQNDQTPANAGDEANLDTQYAFGLSYPISPTFYSTAGSPPFIPDSSPPENTNEPYTAWLDFVLSQADVPLAISTSYGDDEQTVPFSFAKRACEDFAQLGARGVSLMFSSGDKGVGDGDENPATQQCFTNDGRNKTEFIPAFPASCPYTTAVGGTYKFPEVAVPFSGGGFSNYFNRPRYQDAAVGKYLHALPKGLYNGLFNPNGRAFPDVAAQSYRFRIILKGRPALIGGTSASSPTFAGFVALLNDVRLKAGRPSLGFLNPFLYSTGLAGLNDITSGNNAGCGTPGFNSTVGWDPVTGLGTPNFGKLKEIVLRR